MVPGIHVDTDNYTIFVPDICIFYIYHHFNGLAVTQKKINSLAGILPVFV
jgi:hypothetical protein